MASPWPLSVEQALKCMKIQFKVQNLHPCSTTSSHLKHTFWQVFKTIILNKL